jgi:hypothetical protein
VDLEKQKKPTVTICSDRFEILARTTAKGMGMPNLALVIVPHPIGGISPEEVKVKAGNIFDMTIARLLDN